MVRRVAIRTWSGTSGLVTLWVVMVCLATPVDASVKASEYEAKAACIYHFTKFVDWQADVASATEPITIGILGSDPFEGKLEQLLHDKRVRGRTLRIVQLESSEDVAQCSVVFVARKHPGTEDAIKQATQAGVLTVGESDDFAKRGGVINFVVRNRKIAFEINPRAAKRSNIRIDAQLLQLATIVKEP